MLSQALNAHGCTVNKAVALWIESTNKTLRKSADREVLQAVSAVPSGASMLAAMGLFTAVKIMPQFTEESAEQAMASMGKDVAGEEMPYH
jgi:hypothetical protein